MGHDCLVEGQEECAPREHVLYLPWELGSFGVQTADWELYFHKFSSLNTVKPLLLSNKKLGGFFPKSQISFGNVSKLLAAQALFRVSRHLFNLKLG